MLSVTGDPPHVGDYPGSNGVYEIDAIGLTHLLTRLNHGEDYSGKAIDAPTSFYVGVAVNPSAEDLDSEIERFRRKLDAGARFAMTQALFDLAYLDRLFDKIGDAADPDPRGHLAGAELRAGVPAPQRGARGSRSPRPSRSGWPTRARTRPKVGLELARELLEQAKERAAGVYVIPPFKEPAAALDLLA